MLANSPLATGAKSSFFLFFAAIRPPEAKPWAPRTSDPSSPLLPYRQYCTVYTCKIPALTPSRSRDPRLNHLCGRIKPRRGWPDQNIPFLFHRTTCSCKIPFSWPDHRHSRPSCPFVGPAIHHRARPAEITGPLVDIGRLSVSPSLSLGSGLARPRGRR
ncbi:hypothetical protein VTK73DRAFT_5918 [Phialemonium thermophilum]|uniref:Uncharacterized protein n=1 Tax=Phialemonium thermophilum TaxID=223376 RepID=A0ABR3V0X1_9PEZI